MGWRKATLFLAGLLPLGLLLWRGVSNRLGANPVEEITHASGWWALAFLLLTLAITPARRLLRRPGLVRYRRMVGLFAFFYGSLHLMTYLWLDQFFDLVAIGADVLKRPFVTLGFGAFLLMVPLAITSTRAMVRRLGARRWQRLHRLVYASAILGVLHFVWLVKKDLREPLVFAAVLTVLLGSRMLLREGRDPRRGEDLTAPS